MNIRLIVWPVLALVASSTPLTAQSSPRAPFAQLSVGRSDMTGGVQSPTSFTTLDLGIGFRPLPSRAPAVVTAAVVSASVFSGGSLACPLGPGGTCLQYVDEFLTTALLAGAEWRGARGSLQVMAGPTAFTSANTTKVGVQAEAMLVVPSRSRFALVVTPRLIRVPKVFGATHTLRSLHVGVRVC
jgi:hypothetical protein